MMISVWCSLAHTLLASHDFNGSMRRLPHAQARRVPMVSCVLVQLGSHLARLSRFLGLFEKAASHSGFFDTAASRSGAMGANDIQCLGSAWLTPCSPLTLPRFLRDGGLTLRRDGCC
eukprot:scaffold40028_cov67-Phaeocystis_antarctica.AAC.1